MGQIMAYLHLGGEEAPPPPVTQGRENTLISYDYPIASSTTVQTPIHAQQALLHNIPGANKALQLTTTNYQEDHAIRRAILARPDQWQEEIPSQTAFFQASHAIQVYMGGSHAPQSLAQARSVIETQREQTILTARILLGLWLSRRDNCQLSYDEHAAVCIDEILEWRGVQKHQRQAYPGASKRFSDGYQWKHRQQVLQDVGLLQQYALRGYQTVVVQRQVRRFPLDSPYLHITSVSSLQDTGEITGYFVKPGSWLALYELHNNLFYTQIDRRIFQLNPQNDQLALRLALFLTEHWRQHSRTGNYRQPMTMADLLSASMIPVDKANLTARFAPRIEAALAKLHALDILGNAATCLTPIDKNKAQWGKDWLAAYWSILPPEHFLH